MVENVSQKLKFINRNFAQKIEIFLENKNHGILFSTPTQEVSDEDLVLLTAGLNRFDYRNLALEDLESSLNELDFANNDAFAHLQPMVETAIASNEFESLQFITDILVSFRESGMTIDELNALSMDSCNVGNFATLTVLNYELFLTIISSATV